jgi:uncharacterized protein (DUF2235 family)
MLRHADGSWAGESERVTKRLVLCFDGTWNTPDHVDDGVIQPTNVFKMYSAVEPRDATGIEQRKFYGTGVGTGWFDRIRGGAFGWGLSEKIKDGYRFLIDTFDPGDEIFLFGFSRGAYTARSTAGLIRNSGILRREHRGKLEDAYELYRRRDKDSSPDSTDAVRFRSTYSHETNIKFVGVWDTVGALGIPVGIPWLPMTFRSFIDKRWEFHDVRLSRSVENAYHALAIDERRWQFKPTLWTQHPQAGNQVLEQVWFAGAHSNVGGGYRDAGLSDITFLWMKEHAERCGLGFNAAWIKDNIHGEVLGPLRNSRVGIYQILPGRDRSISVAPEARISIAASADERHKNARDPAYAPKPLLRYLRRIQAAMQHA